MRPQERELFGMSEEGERCVADQIGQVLVPGDEHHHGHGRQFPLAE